jgi:bifunctional DNA-binding transcriptional regulator/antitoxin component of YhaV-PrlF toxin-antitoxin module
MKTTEKIQRITSKGQITLPIAWRRRVGASTIVVRVNDDALEITPLLTEDARDEAWVSVFDAVRDNGGKGIPAKDFAKIIRRIK